MLGRESEYTLSSLASLDNNRTVIINYMNEPIQKLAKLLRADPATIERFDHMIGTATHRTDVPAQLLAQRNQIMRDRLASLGMRPDHPHAKSVFEALASKMKADDERLFQLFGEPRHLDADAYARISEFVRKATSSKTGFFLKEETARRLLKNQPPRGIIQSLAYSSADELLENESVWEVFCALRFMENSDWLHKNFLAQYSELTPADFEWREIRNIVLSDKWREPAEYHLRHKYSNVSHLKEMGCIFVIPWTLDRPGESMRIFGLLSHYYHEISFYSQLFERTAKESADKFGSAIVTLIQGDAPAKVPEGNNWMILRRYLAKSDPNDWRIYYPHVNPEAIYWSRAQNDLARFGEQHNIENLSFWSDSDWIGEYFPGVGTATEEFVSFNLMDTVSSTLHPEGKERCRYYQQEALWNKLFAKYIGDDMLEEYIIKNVLTGYFTASS